MLRKIFSPHALLLVAIFVASLTYNLLDAPLSEPSFWATASLAFVLFCAILLVFGPRNLKEANHGLTLIMKGRYGEALALLERAEKRWIRIATVRHNRAIALLGLWRLDEAHALLSAILKRPLAGERSLHMLTKPELALAHALMGEAEAAREIIATSPSAPVLLLTSAVLAVREGRYDEVETLLGGREIVNLSGYHRALADALVDWSRLETGKRPAPTNHRETLFGADGPGTLPTHWPELLAAIDRLGAERNAPAQSSA